MREIIFRGKRVDNGEWVEGGICDYGGGVSIFVVNHYEGSFYEPPYTDLDEIDVDPSTVGQYSGLTDKNGKKIFEGDIVEHFDYSDLGYDIGIFKWDESACRYRRTTGTAKYTNYCGVENACIYEVIGNIYDNPDLIGGEKK